MTTLMKRGEYGNVHLRNVALDGFNMKSLTKRSFLQTCTKLKYYAVVCSRFERNYLYYCIQFRNYPQGRYERWRITIPVATLDMQNELSDIPQYGGAREMEHKRILLEFYRGTERCKEMPKAITVEDAPLKFFIQMYVDQAF